MYNTPKERNEGFVKRRGWLSILLTIVLISTQLLASSTAFAAEKTSPVPSSGTFTPAEGWEKYNYFNYAEALQKSIYFYDGEWCGPEAQNTRLEWRGACHEKDTHIPLTNTNLSKAFIEKNKSILDPDGDGAVDVHGGYHDAGDHVRFGLPQSYATGTLGWGFLEFRDAFQKIGEEQHMLDVLRFATDTYLRCTFMDKGEVVAFCYMVGEGDLDHSFWGPPELYPDSIPRPCDFATSEYYGSDVCASTAASLCTSYMIWKDSEPEYAEKCLTYAKALYEFAKKYRGCATEDGYYNSVYDEDELSWAAVWLYKCTGEISYIREIDAAGSDGIYTGYMKKIVRDNNNNTWQNIWVHSWDVVWGGVFLMLNSLFPENERFEYFARWNIEYLSGGYIKHEDPKDGTYIEVSPAKYAMINGWGSARYNTAAQLCGLVYMKYHPEKKIFGEWAKTQMHYLMGRNPMGYSYIVGYGHEKGLPYARHVHHRAAHGSKTLNMDDPPEHRHILWGALAGGPTLEDYHEDVTTNFVLNEVTVDFNAAFVGALAGFYHFYGEAEGQEPIPNFPPKEDKFDPYYCEARVDRESNQFSQTVLRIHNESSQPPHFETSMKARYFFNISELLECGQKIEDVEFSIAYDEQISLQDTPIKTTGPIKWDDMGTYYYEFDWTGSKVYGDRDVQFSLTNKMDPNYLTHWDSSNDWSRKDLTKEFALTKYVPVYMDGKLAYGEEPPVASPTPVPTFDPNATPANNASVKVMYKCGTEDSSKSNIRASINIQNTGKVPINYSDLKVRYWYTNDGSQSSFVCEYAACGAEKVKGTIHTIDDPVAKADTYCEIGFADDAGILAPGGSTGAIPFRIEGSSVLDQSNDYSFDSKIKTELAENDKITGYVKGDLKYGVEPVVIEPPATPTPTPKPGYKISGYVAPGFAFAASNAAKLKQGFKVELANKYATTDKDGYFEITGVNSAESLVLKITKENYLCREIKYIVVNGDVKIGSAGDPIVMWVGDMVRNGVQDNAINMTDIVQVSKCFNTAAGNAKYIEGMDFNKDGAINMTDIMIIANNFNKTSSDYPSIS